MGADRLPALAQDPGQQQNNILLAGIEAWKAPVLLNGWANKGGSEAVAGYRKDIQGRVFIKGLVQSGTVTTGTAIFALPAGYVPAERHIFAQPSNDAFATITVEASGSVLTGVG